MYLSPRTAKGKGLFEIFKFLFNGQKKSDGRGRYVVTWLSITKQS